KRFVEDFRAEMVHEGLMTFRLSDCNVSSTQVPPVFSGAAFLMNDSAVAQRVFVDLGAGFDVGCALESNWWERGGLSVFPLFSTLGSARAALQSELQSRHVHGVAGVVTEAMLGVEGVAFLDPLQLEPRLNRFRRHVIHPSPTLEQQFFVLAEYLRDTGVHAVVRGEEAAAVAEVLRRSLVTFGGSLRSATLLAGGDALAEHLPEAGDVFVAGLAAGDVAAAARHVASHDGVHVFVAFSEFALLHADFVAAFGGGAGGADRVVFATSLPHWGDANPTSETAREFLAAVPNATQRTPLALMGFAAAQLLRTILPRMDKVGAERLADFFYKNVAVTVKDVLYGSFVNGTACAAAAAGGAGCGKNHGATRISVWSLARALNPAVPVLHPAVTPTMEYAKPVARGLTRPQLIGVVVGGVVGGLLLVGVAALLLRFCRDSRDNANAPKEPTDPVTLVFTDIESSTALWAACSELMSDAVATHHRLIRALIAKYRCYEVKTVGDSFMIACKSVFASAQLVRELQQVFVRHDWGTGALDEAYRKFEEGRAEEDAKEEYVPPTARLDAAVYRQHWNGLRVRVGVHTGVCDIRRDEVTKGYDYYGDTANMAARTEVVGNGGQVLLTRAAYMSLSTAEREQVEVTSLGAVALRVVPRPVGMCRLDAVLGRTFAALRLDRLMPELDASDCDGNSSDFFFAARFMTPPSFSFRVCRARAFPALRAGVLASLCARWRVRGDERGVMSCDEHCGALVEVLARRVSRVYGRSLEPRAPVAFLGSAAS
ncbi:esag4, partial [Trypanosoma conorhini]